VKGKTATKNQIRYGKNLAVLGPLPRGIWGDNLSLEGENVRAETTFNLENQQKKGFLRIIRKSGIVLGEKNGRIELSCGFGNDVKSLVGEKLRSNSLEGHGVPSHQEGPSHPFGIGSGRIKQEQRYQSGKGEKRMYKRGEGKGHKNLVANSYARTRVLNGIGRERRVEA